jgi:hypothetical protein
VLRPRLPLPTLPRRHRGQRRRPMLQPLHQMQTPCQTPGQPAAVGALLQAAGVPGLEGCQASRLGLQGCRAWACQAWAGHLRT